MECDVNGPVVRETVEKPVPMKEHYGKALVLKVWFPGQQLCFITLPGSWLEMKILGPDSMPTESAALGLGRSDLCFNKLPRRSCRLQLSTMRNPGLENLL